MIKKNLVLVLGLLLGEYEYLSDIEAILVREVFDRKADSKGVHFYSTVIADKSSRLTWIAMKKRSSYSEEILCPDTIFSD